MDIRLAQILIMLSLLGFGAFARDFSILPWQVGLTFLAAIGTQSFFIHRLNLNRVGYLSALITALGIAILLRSTTFWVHPLAAFLAISSKFVLRLDGRHVFNPGALGVAVGMLCTASWVSPGQWGSDLATAFWIVALGSVALFRVGTSISTYGFLGSYFSIWALHRVVYLGYEWVDMVHQLQSGALLLFAFFMISDPKTAPKHKVAKFVQALVVAVLAYFWHYWFYYNNGFIWMLLLSNLFVPFLNRIFSAPDFSWRSLGGRQNEEIISAAGAAA